MKRRQLIRSTAGLALAYVALPGRSQTGGKLMLGQSAAFTGPASALGEQFKRGAQLVFDRVNARGGLVADYLAAGRAAAGASFEPNYSSIEGYVAAKTLVEGLIRAGGPPTAQGLVSGLESLRELNLGGFFVDFGPQKHAGSKYVDMTILTADGRIRH